MNDWYLILTHISITGGNINATGRQGAGIGGGYCSGGYGTIDDIAIACGDVIAIGLR